MGMSEIISTAVDTGYRPAPAIAGDRVRECEIAIERALQFHGCRLGVSQIKMDGNVVHQEIVVIDAKE